MEESLSNEHLTDETTDDHIENMVTEFFESPRNPATNHETWLLRVAAILMKREAEISLREDSLKRRPYAKRRTGIP